ncbi:hypothetical protein [Bradyrhizobium japonicum]|uniref:hypothetical protein n=1 Tax=Bradyrhizobium japonicum TaxID=375 RepID=UPI001E55A904|nr:hypothetical protein [Bradyrhizobium japonicum]MCD9824559.1 hypothetical protein [Bradyrhizobium japonicum]MCD9897394.1 hypothetical protein [Bradyrhizobium japonicum]MEB2671136.1 hypothetical protein [Bradyrhizobium japonicum]WLB28624.1 hypothetical protein QIH85_43800 [Bradyrhizobium japonicum]WRI90460.1 hypothetical protein R3F75_05760 [Bradyrhizobium japonicum]
MSRQTTARLASREIGSASIKSPKLTACAQACATARSANTVSTGALLSGSNRFALSSCGHRMPRSVAILKRTHCNVSSFAQPEVDYYGLCRHYPTRVHETCKRHEVPFKSALMLGHREPGTRSHATVD